MPIDYGNNAPETDRHDEDGDLQNATPVESDEVEIPASLQALIPDVPDRTVMDVLLSIESKFDTQNALLSALASSVSATMDEIGPMVGGLMGGLTNDNGDVKSPASLIFEAISPFGKGRR